SDEIAGTRSDRVTGRGDRRETRGAEPVEGDAGDRVREPGEERGHPRDVAVVFSGLVRGSEVNVFDVAARYARPLHCSGDDHGGEIVGPYPGEHASVAADRRPDGGEDDSTTHPSSIWVGPSRAECADCPRSFNRAA